MTRTKDKDLKLKEVNDPKKKYVIFLADETPTTDHTHVEEEKMDDALNNLSSTVTSEANNLTNITMENAKLTEQINMVMAQNKALTNLLSKKICGLPETNSDNKNTDKRRLTDKTRRRDNRIGMEENQWDPLGY